MKKKFHLIGLFIIGFVWSGWSLEGEQDIVCFDRLLPETLCDQIYTLCMRSWYGMRCCEQIAARGEKVNSELQDCLLGSLVRMKTSIKELPDTPPPKTFARYLLEVLSHIEIEQHEYLHRDPLAQSVLRKSQRHLLQRLKNATQLQ